MLFGKPMMGSPHFFESGGKQNSHDQACVARKHVMWCEAGMGRGMWRKVLATCQSFALRP